MRLLIVDFMIETVSFHRVNLEYHLERNKHNILLFLTFSYVYLAFQIRKMKICSKNKLEKYFFTENAFRGNFCMRKRWFYWNSILYLYKRTIWLNLKRNPIWKVIRRHVGLCKINSRLSYFIKRHLRKFKQLLIMFTQPTTLVKKTFSLAQ